ELRRRIRSIRSTAQITRAMQMVAAAKMRRAQQLAIDVRPFVRLFYRIQRAAATRADRFAHPLVEMRPVRMRGVLLVAGDKGLSGSLNANLCRLAMRYDPQSTVFVSIGRKAAQFVAQTRRKLVADFPNGDTPRYADSLAIASLVRDLFATRQVDAIDVIAARFVNTLSQEPVVLNLLPIGDIALAPIPGAPPPLSLVADEAQSLFEPNAADIVS